MERNFEFITQHLIMSRHLNSHQNIFGGIVLGWLDEGAAVYAMEKIQYSNIVTVAMENVFFKNPGNLGDNVKIYGQINNIKNSSIEIYIKAISKNPLNLEETEIISCKILFVCLGTDGRPYKYFIENNIGKQIKKEWLKTKTN
jgi:acyl-CoA hydrolase